MQKSAWTILRINYAHKKTRKEKQKIKSFDCLNTKIQIVGQLIAVGIAKLMSIIYVYYLLVVWRSTSI